jgi:hypothetical protein
MERIKKWASPMRWDDQYHFDNLTFEKKSQIFKRLYHLSGTLNVLQTLRVSMGLEILQTLRVSVRLMLEDENKIKHYDRTTNSFRTRSILPYI